MIALVCCVVCWLDDCLLLVDLLSFVGFVDFCGCFGCVWCF